MSIAAGPILRVPALRALERAPRTVTETSLMEQAGAAAAAVALGLLQDRPGCVLVLAGPGNNGGDGYVLARHLLVAGREVVLASTCDPDCLPGDAREAYLAWLEAGGSVVRDFVGGHWALAVDALLGIGVSRPIEGRIGEWIGRLNALTCPVLALDLPSGLDADSGAIHGCAVRASHTATFIALKPGLLMLDGPDHCGVLSVHALGLQIECAAPLAGVCVGLSTFECALQPRKRNSHKGTHGEAGIIGGAEGMLGAAILAGRAALQLGAGRVYLGLLDSHAPAYDTLQPELMLRAPGELHLLCKALAVGPGLGMGEAAQLHLRRALGHVGPLVLDADALNLIAEHPALQSQLAQREGVTLLTPHPAEAARLLQCGTQTVQLDRLAATSDLARRFRAYVVLKGLGSVIVDPDGTWAINTSGNPALATAGSGDVLTGILVALLAQGWPVAAALRCAVHLHGVAADVVSAELGGPIGATAGELIAPARRALNQWVSASPARHA